MKLLFLVWEFLRSFGKRMVIHVGQAIPAQRLAGMGKRRAKAWRRMRVFLLCPAGAAPERRGRHVPGKLHPEVEDFIGRYGLGEAEMEELAQAVGGEGILEALRGADSRCPRASGRKQE